MMTVISYARTKYTTAQHSLKLVWAGHEPQDFINFFPEWSPNTNIARTNQEVTTVCQLCKVEFTGYFRAWSLRTCRPPTPS